MTPDLNELRRLLVRAATLAASLMGDPRLPAMDEVSERVDLAYLALDRVYEFEVQANEVRVAA
jgi:hypothetical protein